MVVASSGDNDLSVKAAPILRKGRSKKRKSRCRKKRTTLVLVVHAPRAEADRNHEFIRAVSFNAGQFHFYADEFHFMTDKIHLMTEPTPPETRDYSTGFAC